MGGDAIDNLRSVRALKICCVHFGGKTHNFRLLGVCERGEGRFLSTCFFSIPVFVFVLSGMVVYSLQIFFEFSYVILSLVGAAEENG